MDDLNRLLSLAEAYARELPPLPPVQEPPVGEEIAAWIDHTLLKPDATAEQIKILCQEALQHRFAAVCVNPVFAPLAAGLLHDSAVSVCTVVGFPLGATPPSIKLAEALTCLSAGASEIDMVLNVGALKGEAYGQVINDIQLVSQAVHNQRAILKVILEMGLLTPLEKIIACLLCKAAGADFVKTSTGFGPAGATLEDVDLMHRVVGPGIRVKAAGGIRTYEDAIGLIKAGAARIGTSAGVKIVQQAMVKGGA